MTGVRFCNTPCNDIIQQTPNNKLSDTTVIIPGCHKLVQIRIQVFLDVTLRCCKWHHCHSRCWTTLTEQRSITFQRIRILKKTHYRNLKCHIAQNNATDTDPLPSFYVGKLYKSYINSVNVFRHPDVNLHFEDSLPIIRDHVMGSVQLRKLQCVHIHTHNKQW